MLHSGKSYIPMSNVAIVKEGGRQSLTHHALLPNSLCKARRRKSPHINRHDLLSGLNSKQRRGLKGPSPHHNL